MAFKLSPGRGNYAKTGHGIPSPFKQVDKEVDAMIAKKRAQTAADAKSKQEKEASEAAKKEAAKKRIAQLDATEYQAKSDSTATDNRMRKEGFSYLAGKMGNKKANETRAAGSPYKKDGKVTVADQVNEDPKTGKYKHNRSTPMQQKKSPMKQVDKEVDLLIAKKKERDAAAKNLKARTAGEAARTDLERKQRLAKLDATERQAKSDSTSVDTKMREEGFNYLAGKMGNKKANETRAAGSPYSKTKYQVEEDTKSGKYKGKYVAK